VVDVKFEAFQIRRVSASGENEPDIKPEMCGWIEKE
jgi:hypothetical protein